MKKSTKQIKAFFKSKLGQHLYSFAKTYATVFLGIYLTLQSVMSNDNIQALEQLNVIDYNILAISAKGALVSVLRNIYKLLTE